MPTITIIDTSTMGREQTWDLPLLQETRSDHNLPGIDTPYILSASELRHPAFLFFHCFLRHVGGIGIKRSTPTEEIYG
jgi:hypothetical protein